MGYGIVDTIKEDILKAQTASCCLAVLPACRDELLKRVFPVDWHQPVPQLIIAGMEGYRQPYLEFFLAQTLYLRDQPRSGNYHITGTKPKTLRRIEHLYSLPESIV